MALKNVLATLFNLALLFGLLLIPPALLYAQEDGGDDDISGTRENARQNLLVNGEFEEGCNQYEANICVGNGWVPFWITENLDTPNGEPGDKPVFATNKEQAFSGSQSQSWDTDNSTAFAGVYQQVSGVALGDVLVARAHTWAFSANDASDEGSVDGGAWVRQRIGIDPKGGTDPYSSDIRWSLPGQHVGSWGEVSTEATAEGETVTVFLSAYPNQHRVHNEIYFDKATLYTREFAVNQVGGNGASSPAPVSRDSMSQVNAATETDAFAPPRTNMYQVDAEPTVDPLLTGLVTQQGTGGGAMGIGRISSTDSTGADAYRTPSAFSLILAGIIALLLIVIFTLMIARRMVNRPSSHI